LLITAGSVYVVRRRNALLACSTSWNLRPEPHGQRSFLPSFSKNSFSLWTTRKPALYVGLGREPFATLAAWFEEKFAVHGNISFQMDCPSHPKGKPLVYSSASAWPSGRAFRSEV